MKIAIKQDVLMKALEKGAIAATSEVAQADTSNLSLLIQAIKITADKELIIESTTNLMAVKYSLEATSENGIEVKEPGSILIPAKEFINWVKIQNNSSTIAIRLLKSENPEIINPLESIDESDDASEFAITKIGVAKITSKDATKTEGKWELNCYDPAEFKLVDFNEKSVSHFETPMEVLSEALKKVSFTALKSDYDHLLDNVSVQVYKNNLYFITTDTKRCAIYNVLDKESIKCEDALLIPLSLLDQIVKISNKENNLLISYNVDINRLFISQSNFIARIACPDRDNINKFPHVSMLLDKKYDLLAKVTKSSLNQILQSASIVNNSSALFSFDKDKKNITVKAISEDGKYKPSISQTQAKEINQDSKFVWGVKHLAEGLNALKDEDVVLEIPANNKSLKIESQINNRFKYFAMAFRNPIYSDS
jgi:DNA polymerase III sliding clamp (beta) subunit (PCNA family)